MHVAASLVESLSQTCIEDYQVFRRRPRLPSSRFGQRRNKAVVFEGVKCLRLVGRSKNFGQISEAVLSLSRIFPYGHHIPEDNSLGFGVAAASVQSSCGVALATMCKDMTASETCKT